MVPRNESCEWDFNDLFCCFGVAERYLVCTTCNDEWLWMVE